MTKLIQAISCPQCGQFHNKISQICPNCGHTTEPKWQKYLINNSIIISSIFYTNIFFFLVSIVWTIFSGDRINYDFFGFFSPHRQILEKLGMLYPKAFFQGEFFRLINYMFLHGSLLHLILNMFWFYYLSKEVKNFLNSSQLFLVYIISGISGGILSIFFGGNSAVVGSSGAVFGLLGCLLAYGKKRKDIVGFVVWKKFSLLAFVMIIFGFLVPGVSNSGHIGGISSGFAFSWLLFSTKKGRKIFLTLYLAIFVLLIWGLLAALQIL